MPLYEYKCTKCNRRTEKIEPVNGPHLKKCPHCGGKVESLISAPAIQFKGSGWYVTDYAGKSPASESAKDENPLPTRKNRKTPRTRRSLRAKTLHPKDSSLKDSKKRKARQEVGGLIFGLRARKATNERVLITLRLRSFASLRMTNVFNFKLQF